jgi:type I restriction enzyme S subunit
MDKPALPNGWKYARFQEILERVQRKFTLDDSQTYARVGVRWYGNGTFIRDHEIGMNIRRKKQWIIHKDDIVYNKLFAWKNSFAVAGEDVHGCIVSDKFPTYRADPSVIDLSYLRYFFTKPELGYQAEQLSQGAAAISKLTLNPPKFWELEIPLPPLEEQKRIVAQVDALAERIAEARGLRAGALEEAEMLLGAEWDSILETGNASQDWHSGIMPDFVEVNPSKRSANINLSDDDLVTFVPMASVDDITGSIANPEVRPYADVKKGYTYFAPSDVIFAKITPCMQNGKSAVAYELVNDIAFGSTEFHVLRSKGHVLPQWIHFLVRSQSFRIEAQQHFKGSAGQQRVPKSFLTEYEMSIPKSLREQQFIVDHMQNLQAQIDQLRHLQQQVQTEIDALLPSVLDKAFKGEW